MAKKDYIDTCDFTKEELLDMIELARSMKTMIKEGGRYPKVLKDQTLGMIFQQVSTRTRISFETGLGDMPAMSSAHEAMVQSRIKLIEAELELKLANLEWMYVANLLQERFLGLPATEIEK